MTYHEVRCAYGSTEMVHIEDLIAASEYYDRLVRGDRMEEEGKQEKREGNVIVIEHDVPHWSVKIETIESRTAPKTTIKVEGNCDFDEQFYNDKPLKDMVESAIDAYSKLLKGIEKARQDY